jgi:hypothetical protein
LSAGSVSGSTPDRVGAFVVKVVLPEFGAWPCKLGMIGVFVAAYGIPVTFHAIMSGAGGNSLAHVVSVTPARLGARASRRGSSLDSDDRVPS